MAKWHGKVGYIITEEITLGEWVPQATERLYFGDVLRTTSRWSTSNKVNDDLNVTNQISIVADPFAYQNFQTIKYVEFMGALWDVTSVEIQHPRLILQVGGAYNGNTP